ncbi:hypothetical protein SAMN02746089_01022 [Caldanaerobius fijiensis DSM 17918]|uniref:Uncharacterized protein n=1 Tax=Caldanaerobius fijiensis DSM 17918 TaxID=1121256 RepID=A0A1M4XIB5_9THEO|nr:hypothetical protein [Caldanaerobius fijiensis]SHE93141.1 hypothetical protein SAMN02746089_01022 [Caldanaerobius fijiensis DSM 17918]
MSELGIIIINARSPLFRKLPSNIDLDNILCIKKTRTVDNGGVFSLDGQYYQLVDEKGKIAPVTPRAKITVLTSPKIDIRVPTPDHPWKQEQQKTPSYWYVESDREILEALNNFTCAWR